jgi:hypothetical protein
MSENVQQIIEELKYYDGTFPRQALEQAIAHRERIIPELLRVLEYTIEHVDELLEDNAYMAHIYAMFLLAQFHEKRAYPLIVEFFSIPGEIAMDLTGDMVTEDLGRILASVSGGDTGPMKRLIEDKSVNEFVRSAALGGLVTLVASGELSRDEVIEYFLRLYKEKLERNPHDFIWDNLVARSCDLYPEELLDEVQQAFNDRLIDEFFIDYRSVEQALDRGKEKTIERLVKNERYSPIDDTIKEMEGWAAFRPTKRTSLASKPEPRIVDETKDIGRNDPCWCGSGKKYKHCHWRGDKLAGA